MLRKPTLTRVGELKCDAKLAFLLCDLARSAHRRQDLDVHFPLFFDAAEPVFAGTRNAPR